jgi:hypothetical protein
MRNESVFDKLTKALGDTVVDIREKVVEEPMWGRTLTSHHQHYDAAPQWPAAREAQPEAGNHEHDLDMDR